LNALKLSFLKIFFFLFVITNTNFAQELKLIAGPTIGAVDTKTAKIWIGYKGGDKFDLHLTEKNNSEKILPDSISNLKINEENASTFYFKNLNPDTEYQIITEKDYYKQVSKKIYSLKTDPDTDDVKEINFLFGSCNLIMKGFGKLFFPGLKSKIHKNMYQEEADFMVWLGDMVYYLGKDYDSKELMFNRQMKYRQNNWKNNRLQATQPNYTIWDDHDYGPNNSNTYFPLKYEALEIYNAFWPNPTCGTIDAKGTFFTFKKQDIQFFMTDNRFYQTPITDGKPAFLGQKQLDWLKSELKKSDAAFKFIAIGSQVLNPIINGESYLHFPHERDQLLNFIAENNISGVIFLTGDRHISEVHTLERKGKYTMYDFTSSPILSVGAELVAFQERKNSNRIKGSLIARRNYSKANITGEKGNRKLTITYHNKRGKKIREYDILEKDMK
jgi:alkaline phosphatase D